MKEEEEEEKSLSWLNGERGLSVFAVKESMVMVVLVETMVDGGLVLRLIRPSLPEIFIFSFIFIFIFSLYIYIYIL